MILKALYDLAQSEGLVDDPDYVQADVAYYLTVGEGGANPRLVSVMTERKEGKKTFVDLPRIPIPREPGRSGTKAPALFLLDKAAYLFGIGPSKESSADLKESEGEFERFRDRTRDVLSAIPEGSVDHRALSSFVAFLDGSRDIRHQILRDAYVAAATKGEKTHLLTKPIYVVFSPEGMTPLHRMPAIREFWGAQREAGRTSGVARRCLVTGKTGPIADRHTFLKGVPGATSSGVPLVSFNKEAFLSYGLEGNDNAPIGQDAAEGYAAALNRLVDRRPTRPDGAVLGQQNVKLMKDTLAVFWAREPSDFSWLCALADDPDSVKAMIVSPLLGKRAPLEDPSSFFTLVLSGAQGRAIVRSFVTTTTAEVAANVNRYLDDTCIERPFGKGAGSFPLWELLRSLAPLGDTDRLPPRLAAEVYLGAINGRILPFAILESAVRRNRVAKKTEPMDVIAFAARCSLIRASLIRKRTFKEEPTVSLDLNNRQPGYLLGRLLATIDHIQQGALGSLNASLVDRYYGSASTTPGVVFPSLLRRNQHHMSKLRKENMGLAVVREKTLQDALSGLDGFPRTMTLESQGLFALGFHHQRQAFFKKTAADDSTTPSNLT